MAEGIDLNHGEGRDSFLRRSDHQRQGGGVAAFTTRWAKLLRSTGEAVTIVTTRMDWEPMRVDSKWRAHYQEKDISLIELQAPPPLPTRWPEVPTMRMAEIAAPVLKGFDIVYFQDWGNAGFHLIRERRYSRESGSHLHDGITRPFGVGTQLERKVSRTAERFASCLPGAIFSQTRRFRDFSDSLHGRASETTWLGISNRSPSTGIADARAGFDARACSSPLDFSS